MNYTKLRQELKKIKDEDKWTAKNPVAYDHIRVRDGLFYHHAVYKSDDVVYHMTYQDGDIFGHKGYFEICTLDKFKRNQTAEVRIYSEEEKLRLLAHQEIDQRLTNILGDVNYDLLFSNCEHYVNHITMNQFISYQVQQLNDKPIDEQDNKGINHILESVYNIIK